MIDNPQASRVKRVAALARKKDRHVQGRFLVEGPQAVREALKHRPECVETVYSSGNDQPWQREFDQLAVEASVPVERVSERVLAVMSETVHPQGVLAVARSWGCDLGAVCDAARLVVILHEVRDPGNAGAVIRSADAAGADAVLFSGESIDPFHPKVVRSTTGSLFHVPVCVVSSLGEGVEGVRRAGLTVLAADVGGGELFQARAEGVLARPVAWVFGNEARGLCEEDRARADCSLKLPMYGAAESLNLASAASVLLYETAFSQRGVI